MQLLCPPRALLAAAIARFKTPGLRTAAPELQRMALTRDDTVRLALFLRALNEDYE